MSYYRRRHRKFRDFKKRKKYLIRDICPLCAKPINKVLTSIVHKESGKKAHFDCIIKELKKIYALKPQEEIYYLGGGSFGIIEGLKDSPARGFVIKRRFQYEEKP